MTSEYPQALDVWGGGQLLAFSGIDGPTPFRHALAARTAMEGCGICVKFPGEALLWFSGTHPQRCFVANDVLDVAHDRGRTRAVFVDACHLLIEGPCEIRSCGPELRTLRSDGRTLVGAASGFDAGRMADDIGAAIHKRLRWIADAPKPALGSERSTRTYWKALSIMKGFIYAPEGRLKHHYVTPDRWPHHGMWLWDSAFQAIGLRHADPAMAWDAVAAVLDVQRADGFIPIGYHHDQIPDATQPPTLAMAAQLVDRLAPNPGRLADLFPKLVAYLEWDMRNRTPGGAGLVGWRQQGHNTRCRCGESGWDNSPRWDGGAPLDAVDFNAWLANECEILAEFAGRLGKHDEQRRWSAHHERLCQRMNERLWCEDRSFYVDCLAATGEPQPYLTAAGFLPLLCGAPDARRAECLARHLRTTFDTPVPVATVAPEHTDVYSKDMWRGPMWPNINWAIAEGFSRYGMTEEAARIRQRTCEAIETHYQRYGSIFEYYDSADEVDPPRLPRKGSNDPAQWIHQVVFDYGWSAALYVDMVRRG